MMSETAVISVRYRTHLRNQMNSHFSLDELASLCYELGVEFENLVGSTKISYVESLIALFERHGDTQRLVSKLQTVRPNVVWSDQARVFISYKRRAEVDSKLAHLIADTLAGYGHAPFIDVSMRVGTDWLDEIDSQLRNADFLIVLLSEQSADSEMVQQEVQRARDYSKLQGRPSILPIRIRYEGMLPYSIAAFLSSTQYLLWNGEDDNDGLMRQLVHVLAGGELTEKSYPHLEVLSESQVVLAEDGRPERKPGQASPPLPEFDPRCLVDLAAPGGTMRISDTLYIEREGDVKIAQQLQRSGSITTIRAGRQTGKSSMLARAVFRAKQSGAKVVSLDLQRVDSSDLQDADSFMLYLANYIMSRLRLDTGEVERFWKLPLGAQDRLSMLMEDVILPSLDSSMILAIDEADRLLETSFYSDFFGLLRSWHNSAAYDPSWEMLNLAMVISTEPYLLIADPNQSPFNVGLKIYLEDFTPEQVENLNARHGGVVAPENMAAFYNMLSGHPYLTRKALYTLAAEQMEWVEFQQVAASDSGPFSDHLRRQMWLLHKRPELMAALREIIRTKRCDQEEHRFRLLRAGLIQASGDVCQTRCELYQTYFEERLT